MKALKVAKVEGVTKEERKAIKKQIKQEDLSHTMRHDHWREVLFSKAGQNVRVEDDVLRFYLIE